MGRHFFAMTRDTAEKVANVVLVAAALGAAVVVLRVPTLRKIAFGLAASALSTHLPAWFKQETKRAWSSSPTSAGLS